VHDSLLVAPVLARASASMQRAAYPHPFPHRSLAQAKENKAKANPTLAAENKASADAKRERRKESGSTKEFK
jgi:hypothetical protein